ncbi:sigma-70 family RNA polymerase sigma factor [Hymenobacter sp. YC55]|uniref:RNA polymerase sigma factor n=1 Tax=Hymenobacter sp. YC55 TaxID=3034019 RepID=UPI0023F995FF|nr:sigma-70 family RNA polymerase sigma factor [Hymenobacter sp. YC55]MDF7814741.1 sigma-70 family RNA polymerase sigma factor [Hymenobacter sp. YC55]
MATPVPDSVLIQQVIEGSTAAFGLLVARYQSLAFHIAYKLLRHRQTAEEATQDAFLKAYRGLANFHGDAKFSTWLYRIVYTTAVSHARRKQLPTSSLSDENAATSYPLVDDARTQFQALAHHDQKVYLEAALATLAPDEALLITLFYQHEHSVEEISQIVGLGKANIKVKLLRTRRKLYAVLHQLLKQEIADLL